MKTPAPITGGMNCPPVEAIASMAPASCGRKPVRFMSGMVKEPVVTTLATEEPEIEPNSAEVRTAILAGPPRRSEEHTSELQSLMRISYAVFCLKKKNTTTRKQQILINNVIQDAQTHRVLP